MTGSTLDCSMDGYQTLVQEILNIALVAITLILSGMPDLQRAFSLSYSFLKGSAGWIGYIIAAAYFFSKEIGVGDQLCEYSQYGYLIIYYLNIAVTFGQ